MFRNTATTREFQAGLNTEQTRRQRQDQSLSLRRKEREMKLQNKRQRILKNNSPKTCHSKTETETEQSLLNKLPQYVKGIFTEHKATIFECVRSIRQLLAFQHAPPIKQVVDCGIIDRVISFLQWTQCPKLQFEAVWILTNIASSTTAEYTATIINKGCIHSLLKLLKCANYALRDQSLWCLGNIAGESKELRNLLIKHDILSHILCICKEDFNAEHVANYSGTKTTGIQQYQSMFDLLTWLVLNLCRYGGGANDEYTAQILECLHYSFLREEQMNNGKHTEISQNIAWTFKYITQSIDWEQNCIETADFMFKQGLTSKLVNLLFSNNTSVKQAALKAVGDIVTSSNDKYTQQCIDGGLLKALHHLLTNQSANERILKEILRTISNITAGTKTQILAVMRANILPFSMEILNKGVSALAGEALWSLSNSSMYCADSVEILKYLMECELFEALCSFLTKYMKSQYSDRIMTVALECIENILACDDWKTHRFAIDFESNGGVDFLEYLQCEENVSQELYEKVSAMIQKYFNDEDDDDLIVGGDHATEFNIQSKVVDNQFVFGVNQDIARCNQFSF